MLDEPYSDDVGILIVDDTRLDQQLLAAHLSPRGYKLDFANDGVEAMSLLEVEPLRYHVVLLDRQMPRLGGLEVLARIKQNSRLRMLPVIMQSGSAKPEEIREGILAGAYYYLTKPYDPETLVAVVATAARDFAEYHRLQTALARGLECLTLIQSGTLLIRTIAQARDSAAVLANACPEPSSAVIGLTELLVNAVEHGNLGISYEEKTILNADGRWEGEVRRRMSLPENASKRVELRIERDESELRFIIRDEGPGFAWNRFLEVDPKRAFDNHGRGIAISRAMSFHSVEYRGAGNEVVATVRLPAVPAVKSA
jgi:sigma-B regulation protein RsbU (phosphoserine phosphatase)